MSTILPRASIERAARSSVKNPIPAFMITTTIMAINSGTSPKASDTPPATARRSTMRLLNWFSNMAHALTVFASPTRFLPNSPRRFSASSAESPDSGATPSVFSTSSTVWL